MFRKSATAFTITALVLAINTLTFAEQTDTIFTRDFSLGLTKDYVAVKPYSEDDDGEDGFERFMQVKNHFPAEIPVFKPYEADGKHKIFVALNGDDSDLGNIDSPLKTIDAALQRAASIKDKSGGIVIFIREGNYGRTSPITIPSLLKGSDSNPIIISAYGDEKVQLAGGITIEGSSFLPVNEEDKKRLPDSTKDNTFYVDFDDLGITDFPEITKDGGEPTVYVNNIGYNVARWPNTSERSMVKTVDANNKYAEKFGVIHPGNREDYLGFEELENYMGGFEFEMDTTRPFQWKNIDDLWIYGSVQTQYERLHHKIKELHEETNSLVSEYRENIFSQYNGDLSFYFLNVLEELDVPGEFYLNAKERRLYICPYEDISKSSVFLPVLNFPLIDYGKGVENVVFNNLTITAGATDAINIEGYHNVIQNCDVYGKIVMKNYNSCGVVGNIIHNGGVRCYFPKGNAHDTHGYNDAVTLEPSGAFIQNNYLFRGTGISVDQGVRNVISHNCCIRTPSTAYGLNCTQEMILEYNEGVGTPYKTLDSGTFYGTGRSELQGNHVRYNFFHHDVLTTRGWSSFGVYYDDMGSNNYAYGNVVQNMSIFTNGGSDMVFYNNLILDQHAAAAVTDGINYYQNAQWTNYADYYRGSSRNNYYEYKPENKSWLRRFPLEAIRRQQWMDLSYERKDDREVALNPELRSEFDWHISAAKRNVYKNNIYYNCNPPCTASPGEWGQFVETNYEITDKNTFEDYDNSNYGLTDDCDVYEKIPDFEKIPFDKMGTIVNDIFFKTRPTIGNFYARYPKDGEQSVPLDDNHFIWSEAEGAIYYIFEISDDEKFENIIEKSSEIEELGYTLDKSLEEDKVYYWRVTAYSEAKSLDNTPLCKTFTFKTMSREEAKRTSVLETKEYDNLVANYKAKIAALKEEDGKDYGVGVYKKGTVDRLNSIVDESLKIASGFEINIDVQNEMARLENEFKSALKDASVPYVRKYNVVEQSDWAVNNGKMEFADGVWTATAEKTDWIRDKRILSPNESISVDLNLGNMGEWCVFALKQMSEDSNWVGHGYYIVYKTDQIEIQKHGDKTTGIVDICMNNSQVLTPNQWHNVQISFNNTDEYVNIKVDIDGKQAFDYYDKEDDRMYDEGYFAFETRATVGPEFKLRAAK